LRTARAYRALLAGFEGEYNSARILLDKLFSSPIIEKVYLKNAFDKCAEQIINHIQKNKHDIIIAFGQKPVIKAIYIEKVGRISERKQATVFQFETLQKFLIEKITE